MMMMVNFVSHAQVDIIQINLDHHFVKFVPKVLNVQIQKKKNLVQKENTNSMKAKQVAQIALQVISF